MSTEDSSSELRYVTQELIAVLSSPEFAADVKAQAEADSPTVYRKLSELRVTLEGTGHNITHRTILNWCIDSKVDAIQTETGQWRIPQSEFDRVVAERGGKPSRVHPERKRKTNAWTDNDHLRALERRYGISRAEYFALCEANDWRCTICEKQPHVEFAHMHIKSQRLNLDHDHTTGAARGLLCQRCNKHVAFAGDRVDLIRRILLYVEGKLTPAVQLEFFDKSA